jgi:hypothetical protein
MLAAARQPGVGEILRLRLEQAPAALLDRLEIHRVERPLRRHRLGRRRRHRPLELGRVAVVQLARAIGLFLAELALGEQLGDAPPDAHVMQPPGAGAQRRDRFAIAVEFVEQLGQRHALVTELIGPLGLLGIGQLCRA